MSNRWKCPKCGSDNVEVCYPAWFKESTDFDLTFVEADTEADIRAWYCPDCNDSDEGEPDKSSK